MLTSFVRIIALSWADLLAGYVMWVMQTYLTNVWKLSVTHAAAIINVFNGVTIFLPIPFAFFADSIVGNFCMLVFSTFAYVIGLGFLTLSTPTFIGRCKDYEPKCIGQTQRTLFYIALALISVGSGGHIASQTSFMEEQEKEQEDSATKEEFTEFCDCSLGQKLGCLGVAGVMVGSIALPFIKPWSVKFGIPAICSFLSLIVFLTGLFWYPYKQKPPQGSPVTTIIRVFVAAHSKKSEKLPEDHNDAKNLYMSDDHVKLTQSLRCLDKAAIILPNATEEEQKNDKYHLCSVTEVEETKICLQMVPMWIIFILSGLVLSLGNTYFLEQANHMDRKLGHLKVPLVIFLVFSGCAAWVSGLIYSTVQNWFPKKYKNYTPLYGIAFALITSILCCITAAKVETRRLKVIRTIPDLLKDSPPGNIKIPMTMFWLVPQYLLLGVSSLSSTCFEELFKTQYPSSMNKYLKYFTDGLIGIGTAASYLSVYIVGKVSERGGTKPSWFQHTLNQSRLDRYYWTLAVVSCINLFLYILMTKILPDQHLKPEPKPEEKKDDAAQDPPLKPEPKAEEKKDEAAQEN